MIETPSSCRARYFEARAYHDIMLDAVKDGVEWIAAPKPILSDASYQFEDIDRKPSLTNLEPVFDAPNCVRMGKDIMFQISNTGNHWGLQWLKNTLEPRGYRIHPAEHIYSYGHFDSTIIPLRPGLVLLNSSRVTKENCPKLFEKWDKIWFDDCIVQGSKVPGGVAPCSPYIGMNILSVNPNTIICDSTQEPLMRELDKHGVDSIPVQFRHAMTLSGGIHCATLDLRRTGTLEDYFS
jgi:N-dimethylarginine dimethylaminohydrolase